MPTSDVVLWMADRKASGTLSVRRRSIETRFTIREGNCFQASSTDPREYFGQHLINFGYIDEEQLQRAFDTQKETHVPLGRVLVMVEAITAEQLQRVLTFKTREGLLEALCWDEGAWKLVPDVDDDRELDCERPINLKEVWSEGKARQQMWSEIRRVFPSDATRVDVLAADSVKVDSTFDRKLITLMKQGKTVGEAALELRAMDFQTYARLYDLMTRQLIRPRVTTEQVELRAPLPKSPSSSMLTPAPPAPKPMPPPPPPPPADDDVSIDVEVDTTPPFPVAPPAPLPTLAAMAQPAPPMSVPPTPVVSPSPSPSRSLGAPRAPTPMGSFFGAGSYMMVRPEKAEDPPGVKKPPEAENPEQALRLALAGRDWSAALLISQRILEQDPLNSEAIAAYRVAEAQIRRRAKETPVEEPNLDRVPQMAQARDEVALAHLSSKERYVLSRVDGKRTLQQIAAVSPIQRTELIRIVEAFEKKGVLKF